MKQQLQTDLKSALRSHDEHAKSVIRLALAAIVNAEVERRGELDEGDILAVLQKEVQIRQETINELRDVGRPDLLVKEELELSILEKYIPESLTRTEIVDVARQVISEVGATGTGDLGLVMRILMPRVKGRADGRVVNEVVRELLSA
ncbi:MAG: GatB/YqeY domain-containing protein [Chloroflexi bacterium]|nr:GatB/YqeY domain-containing protein [Chloroflexota bacterium]